jgi:hypothetical protein
MNWATGSSSADDGDDADEKAELVAAAVVKGESNVEDC